MTEDTGGTSLRTPGALLICTLFCGPLFAQAPPSADTFVSSGTPKINYGQGITLNVASGTTSYVQFNLAGVPAGATIGKAMLRLFVDGVITAGNFDVYQLNGSWSESKLTYSTPPPALGASATGNQPISINTSSVNQFVLIDITSLVQGWVSGTIANNGVALALTGGSNGSFSFDSKESLLTGNGPELEIALAGGTGTQGSQGPTGPQGLQGGQGPQGLQGPTGPQGATGSTGPAGKDGAGFKFRANFDNSVSYAVNDVVSYGGSSYVAIAANQGPNNPTPDKNPSVWIIMAQQGAAGPAGASGSQGPQGATGPQGVQGNSGPQGSAGASGQTGATGAQGPQGPAGPAGPAGSALTSLDSLAGVPCTRNGQTGTVSITYSAAGDATLNCTLSAGGGTNSPQLAALDIQPTNTPGLLSGVVTTAAPVSSDLTASLSISTFNSTNGQAGIYSLSSPSVVIPSGRTSASFYVVWVSGNYNPSTVTMGTVIETVIATAGTSSISRGFGNNMESFACMGTPSTVAADPLTISGTVLAPGMTGAPVSASGVTIQAYLPPGTTPIVSTTSDASGSFSLSVPTGGVPFNGYLMISGAGFLNAAAFWSKPLTSATITAPFVLNSSEQAQLYQLGGTSAQVGTSPVAFRVVDCAGTPLGDAALTINPVPIGAGGPFTAQSLGFNLGAPNFWALNEPAGSVTVSATDHGITFGQTTFMITAGQTVYVTITP